MIRSFLLLRSVRCVALLVALTGAVLCRPVGAQSTCRSADAVTRKTIPLVDSIINGRTATFRLLRDSLRLAAPRHPVTPSLITKTSACASAGKALDALDTTATTARNLYVYQAGSYYAVEDPTRLMGEFNDLVFFTSGWIYSGDLPY